MIQSRMLTLEEIESLRADMSKTAEFCRRYFRRFPLGQNCPAEKKEPRRKGDGSGRIR
jgi:hypothetical protein